MGIHLNSNSELFKQYHNNKIFIDKSHLINFTNESLNTDNRFICITRPRRFGKTLMFALLNAYYSKGSNFKEIFDTLNISSSNSYLDHLNKHNVISLDIGGFYYRAYSPQDFLDNLRKDILEDFEYEYKDIDFKDCTLQDAIIKVNKITNQKFIFLLNEWDILLRDELDTGYDDNFIIFIKSLLDNKEVRSCIELFFMTGILPTTSYKKFISSISVFQDYSILDSKNTKDFIGYTEDEVIKICKENDFEFEKNKRWYDGYNLNGLKIYNPVSVNDAIERKRFSYRWSDTCSIESLSNPLGINNLLKEETAYLIAGYSLPLDISSNLNDLELKNNQDSILIRLILLGYLTYDQDKKECRITNYEIRERFYLAAFELKWKEIYIPIENSIYLHKAILKGNLNWINEILDEDFNLLASISEEIKKNILKVFVQHSFFDLYKFYDFKNIELDSNHTTFAFIPYKEDHIPMIIELKKNQDVDIAINQIKNKDYSKVFSGYKGKILLLGITYDSSTLKHESKIEYIEL